MTTRATILELMHKVNTLIDPGFREPRPAHPPRGVARPPEAEFLAMAIIMTREWMEAYPVIDPGVFGCWLCGVVLCGATAAACLAGEVDLWVGALGAGLLTASILLDVGIRLWTKLRVAGLVLDMEEARRNIRLIDAA